MNNIVVGSYRAIDETVVYLNEPPRMWMNGRNNSTSAFFRVSVRPAPRAMTGRCPYKISKGMMGPAGEV